SGNSTASTGIYSGGGIVAGGPTTITGTTISGNSGAYGSGINFSVAGSASLTNTTISGNATGPAVEVTSASQGVTLTNTTVAANASGVAVNTAGGGGTLIVKNSILKNSGVNCPIGTITSGGYNLVSDLSCGFSGGTDLLNTNPNIAPLALNAPGTTATHALNAGSPAIDKIPAAGGCNNAGITTDQRGIPRPIGAGCDIGAYEFFVNPLPGQQPAGPPAGQVPAPLPAGRQPVGPPAGQVPNPLPGGRPRGAGGASVSPGATGGNAPAPVPTHR
ncbi:MAG: choice-of-anchor Q domain-containing protein, partial [Thermomicrobiales bacterium]